MYVFDRRMHMEFGPKNDPDYRQLGECEDCGAPTNEFVNRDRGGERILVLLCDDCAAASTDPTAKNSDDVGRRDSQAAG